MSERSGLRRRFRALSFADFGRRVEEVCREELLFSPFSAISLPVPGEPRGAGPAGSLVSLVFSRRGSGGGDNPLVLSPSLAVRLSLTGELVSLEKLPFPDGGPVALGRRWGGAAARMKREERDAFRATYHELLVRPGGPSVTPWDAVAPEVWKDLATLLRAVAEAPLLPHLRERSPEFLARLDAAR